MAQYNEPQYNVTQYNINIFPLVLVEALTSADTDRTFVDEALKTEIITVVDVLSKLFNDDPRLEDIMVMQDSFAPLPMLNKVEAIVGSDNRVVTVLKALTETMTPADSLTFLNALVKGDAVLLTDVLTKQVVNKGLPETIRLAEWTTIKRAPAQGVFGD